MMNEPKINEDTLKLIEARVLWAERTNLDTNERNDSDMADRIIEIIVIDDTFEFGSTWRTRILRSDRPWLLAVRT